MKRTTVAVAVVLVVTSVGLGFVVGRSGGGDTGNSISSRLSISTTTPTDPSADSGTPHAANPASTAGLASPVVPAPSTTGVVSVDASIPASSVLATPATPLMLAPPLSGTPESATAVAMTPATSVSDVATPAGASDTARATPAMGSVSSTPGMPPSNSIPPNGIPSPPSASVGGDGIPIDYRTPQPSA